MVSPSNHRPYIYLTTIFLRQPQDKSFFFDSCFNVSISPRMRASFLALLHPWSCCSLMRASCWASLFLLLARHRLSKLISALAWFHLPPFRSGKLMRAWLCSHSCVGSIVGSFSYWPCRACSRSWVIKQAYYCSRLPAMLTVTLLIVKC